MLKKLLKHDFLSTYKKYLSTYILVFLATAILPLLFVTSIKTDEFVVLGGLGIFAYFIIIFAVSILILVSSYRLLHDSFYKPQGYLTFTLPFPTKTILLSKIITSFVYLISYIVVLTLGFIVVALELPLMTDGAFSFTDLVDVFREIGAALDIRVSIFDVLLPLFNTIVNYLWFIVLVPLAGALCHSSNSKKTTERRTGFIFILLYFASNMLLSLILRTFGDVDYRTIQIVNIVYYTVLTVGGFYLTAYYMDYKIDLE